MTWLAQQGSTRGGGDLNGRVTAFAVLRMEMFVTQC